MISPGAVPRWGRMRVRGPIYTRVRRRALRKRRAAPDREPSAQLATYPVVFDHGPPEFPLAVLRPRRARARLIAAVGALQRHLAARWAWLRPRAVPVLAAVIGALVALAAVHYLTYGDALTRHVMNIQLR